MLNKVDRLAPGTPTPPPCSAACSPDSARPTASGDPGPAAFTGEMRAVAISAVTGAGIDALLAAIDDVLPLDPVVRTTLDLDPGDGATLALLHEFGRVLETRYHGDRVEVEVDVPESLERRLRHANSDPLTTIHRPVENSVGKWPTASVK